MDIFSSENGIFLFYHSFFLSLICPPRIGFFSDETKFKKCSYTFKVELITTTFTYSKKLFFHFELSSRLIISQVSLGCLWFWFMTCVQVFSHVLLVWLFEGIGEKGIFLNKVWQYGFLKVMNNSFNIGQFVVIQIHNFVWVFW